MKYDFDQVIDRKGTSCLKYDFAVERGRDADALPMWVADMDFQTAPEITARLLQAVQHGIYGYSESKEAYYAAVTNWYEKHFGWKTQRRWIIKTPGVVFALAAAVRAFTKKGDSVLIQQPVYYPFSEVIVDNERNLVNNSLKQVDGHYEIDFDDFEKKIQENDVKLFLMCSPHNPVGRVWQEWELRKIGDICVKHDVIVVSDEIHGDFVYPGHQHTVFASLSPEYESRTVTCTAPSKTFNLAGLQVSNIFIPNPKLRAMFKKAVDQAGYSQVNLMGLVGCQAAYETGEEWLIQLKEYLNDNLAFFRTFMKERIPELKLIEPEGTYLLWVDFCALELTEAERENLLLKKAHLWLDSGAMFGLDGEGFERFNIACPRQTLKTALEQLEAAIHA